MALPPTYTNFVAPAIDAANLNEVNLVNYQLLGNGVNAPVTRLELINNLGILAATPGRLIGTQTFTANGTYTPTVGTTRIIVEAIGSGGAGGGAPATGAGQVSVGSGGAGGSFGKTFLTSGFAGTTVTIGAGGVGVAGGTGGTGGTTSFGAFLVVNGSGGGIAAPANTTSGDFGGGPGACTGGNIVNGVGQRGASAALAFVTNAGVSASGGSSLYGAGGVAIVGASGTSADGVAGTGPGAGGGGAFNWANAVTPKTGGAGTSGIIIIYEYS